MNLIIKIIIQTICIFTLLNSIVFVGLSVSRSVHAYSVIGKGDMQDHPGALLVESLDGFLLAILFLIFSIGFGKLFLADQKYLKSIHIPWLEPKSFSDLKHILWETVLTTLLVLFAIMAVQNTNKLDWNLLILPISILLISASLKMLRGAHK